jgi:gliding motility-associated-like protein
VNSTTILTNPSAGGTWSINNTGVAGINQSTGVTTGITAGKATVTYTVTNGCGTASSQFGIVVNNLPYFSLGNDTAICTNSKLLLDASIPNVSYQWQDGSTVSSRLVTLPQLYWLKITDSNSCHFSDTIMVQNKPLPLVRLGNDTTLCNDLTLLLDAKGSSIAGYQWNDGSTQPMYTVTKAGQYDVIATALNGCTNRDTIKVNYLYSPQVNIGPGATICPGNPVIIDPHLNNVSFLWQDGSTKPAYTVTEPGIYSLTATNSCGSSTANVEFKRGLCRLLMPTAFTPNNDRVNDVFRVPHAAFIRTFQFTIFNRWGEKVFETTDPSQGWNGMYKGIDQDLGNYTWFIKLTDFAGNSENAKGSVVLVR